MKKILAAVLCGIVLLCGTACNDTDIGQEAASDLHQEANTDESSSETDSQYSFISIQDKKSWKTKLSALLSNIEVRDSENAVYGSFAIGLMDLNFDNTPEVLAAYPGGSMGNVYVEKNEYDTYYQQFLNDYQKIDSTQIQLIYWHTIDAESKDQLAEKMADALINSSQEFIDFN